MATAGYVATGVHGGSAARPILSDTIAFALLIAAVAAMFGISGSVLWDLGINYDGLTGNGPSKIHPSTYIICLLFGWVIISARSPVSSLLDMIGRRPASAFLLLATLIFFLRTVLSSLPGMAGILDTFLSAALVGLLLSRAGSRSLAGIELVIHAIMTINALMGLYEFLTASLIFPFRLDGMTSPYDLRATALQGHPLQNAALTSVYVLALLSGGGPAIGRTLRPLVITLQCAALVTFGGRSAMVVTLVLGAGVLIWQAHSALGRGKVSLAAVAAVLGALTLVPLAVAGLAFTGFFDNLLGRFVSDGGSANARLVMFDIFGFLSWRDVLVGPDPEWLASIRRLNNLELGLENPIIRTLLTHGLIFTVLMTLAVALYLREVGKIAGYRSLLPMIGFVILINTFESLGGKTTMLTKFALMMICFYRPMLASMAWPRYPLDRPSASRTGGRTRVPHRP